MILYDLHNPFIKISLNGILLTLSITVSNSALFLAKYCGSLVLHRRCLIALYYFKCIVPLLMLLNFAS